MLELLADQAAVRQTMLLAALERLVKVTQEEPGQILLLAAAAVLVLLGLMPLAVLVALVVLAHQTLYRVVQHFMQEEEVGLVIQRVAQEELEVEVQVEVYQHIRAQRLWQIRVEAVVVAKQRVHPQEQQVAQAS